MTRRVRTALSPVLTPILSLLRRRPLVLPGLLFVLVLGLGLSGLGRPGPADEGASRSAEHAWLAGARTVPSDGPSGRAVVPHPTAQGPESDANHVGPTTAAPSLPVPTGGPGQLPRGGTQLFPRYRLVGYSGGPHTAAFGRLGIGRVDDRVAEIERRAAAYAAGREPLPVLELITVVAQAKPGRDGKYRLRIDDAVVAEYLAAARRHRAMLLLNVQPGRADFLPEVKGLERWLREPDVGVALDPEWAVGPRQVPGRVYGNTTGKELDGVAAYLAGLARRHDLPQKAMVVHQLAPRIITDFADVGRHPEVAVIQSVDGIGARADKEATWRRLVATLPPTVHPGFKLFFEEDAESGPLMTPRQVLGLLPQPEYVLYE
jgi:hypothetical protein